MIAGLNPAHQMRQILLYNCHSMQAWTPKETKENSAFVRFYPLGKIRKVQRQLYVKGKEMFKYQII